MGEAMNWDDQIGGAKFKSVERKKALANRPKRSTD